MVDLQKEARRGRAARAELALVKEHIDEEKQRLFGQFCDPRSEEEIYVIREEAKALADPECLSFLSWARKSSFRSTSCTAGTF